MPQEFLSATPLPPWANQIGFIHAHALHLPRCSRAVPPWRRVLLFLGGKMRREASAASVRELCSAGMGGLESSWCYAVTRGSLGSRGGAHLERIPVLGSPCEQTPERACTVFPDVLFEGLLQRHKMGRYSEMNLGVLTSSGAACSTSPGHP